MPKIAQPIGAGLGNWRPMNSSYFDVQDIFAEEQRIKIRFLCSVVGTGLCGVAGEGQDCIDKYSIMELPLWLSNNLIKTPFAEKITPRAFSVKVRSDLNANTCNVQLKDVSTHYYSLGLKLMHVFADQRLSDHLYATFIGRLALLVRPLQCSNEISGVSPLDPQSLETLGICPPSKLDSFEHYVFQLTNASRHQYDGWLRRDILEIKAAELK